MKKSKMGRPKIARSIYKGVLIGVRFTPSDVEKIQAAADRQGQLVSEWVRNILLKAAQDGTI